MGLSFNHQRDVLGRKPNLPNELDQNRISRTTLSARANSRSVNLSGYTDLRGRFDFTSLNTNELENVRKFSLLILSDNHGAIVRDAMPPKR